MQDEGIQKPAPEGTYQLQRIMQRIGDVTSEHTALDAEMSGIIAQLGFDPREIQPSEILQRVDPQGLQLIMRAVAIVRLKVNLQSELNNLLADADALISQLRSTPNPNPEE